MNDDALSNPLPLVAKTLAKKKTRSRDHKLGPFLMESEDVHVSNYCIEKRESWPQQG